MPFEDTSIVDPWHAAGLIRQHWFEWLRILSSFDHDPMYGPAVRCKRFRRSGGCGLASMYPVSDWSLSWLPTIMDISARASSLAVKPHRAIGVTSVRTRREDRSSISSHPLADLGGVNAVRCVIDRSSFEPFLCSCLAAVSFVRPAHAEVPRAVGRQRLAVALVLPLAPLLPGHALTGPSTARWSSWSGRHLIRLDALEGAPLVENCPGDAGELVRERNRQHVMV